MNIGYKRCVDFDFKDAVEKVKEALVKEGFGIMSEVAVSEHMRTKLNVNFEDYVILGACIPSFAYKVLSEDKEIGLLLPCNVIVYSENGKIFVSSVLPSEMMRVVDGGAFGEIVLKVEEKLKRVVDSI